MWRLIRLGGLLLGMIGILGMPAVARASAGLAQSASSCAFVLGFRTLHDLIPTIVGGCGDDEQHNPANGDALQHTTGGLLVWRKADNWTAFTDGYRTWINGPNGLQERLNTQRFPWEADYGAPGTTPAPAATPVAGAALPVLLCETSHGVAGQTTPVPPSSLAPDTASPLLSQLTFYTDGATLVLGPRDWLCNASIGADGQDTISVYPPQDADNGDPSEPVISAHGYSACQGCVEEVFCALFPAAWGNGSAVFRVPTCPARVPAQEQVVYLDARVATFEDPPGVAGDGVPSGGTLPSNGVALYNPVPQVSYKETCLLPEPNHAECTAILNDFVARYGQ